ncbi:MAG: hypothetical protein ACOWYE_05695 [Desulfatiglandales bacterium]
MVCFLGAGAVISHHWLHEKIIGMCSFAGDGREEMEDGGEKTEDRRQETEDRKTVEKGQANNITMKGLKSKKAGNGVEKKIKKQVSHTEIAGTAEKNINKIRRVKKGTGKQ